MKHLYALLLLSLSLNAQVAVDTTAIDNVEIVARKQSKEVTTGNASRRNAVIQPHSSDWDMLGKLFPYKQEYIATPYLQSVMVITRNKSETTATFKLHLYKMGVDSLPAEELVLNGILVETKRGVKKNNVDLTSYNLTMPKEGLIVGYEWLKNDNNLYPYEATGSIVNDEVVMAEKKDRALTYAPDLYRNDGPEAIGYWCKGTWHKFLMNQWAMRNGMWLIPAINMTLTN
jgi:hypothetical protein